MPVPRLAALQAAGRDVLSGCHVGHPDHPGRPVCDDAAVQWSSGRRDRTAQDRFPEGVRSGRTLLPGPDLRTERDCRHYIFVLLQRIANS